MAIIGFPLILITGIIVMVLSYTLDHLWAAAMPARAIYLFIRLPGVVLHECAHILGCFLTGARIRKVVLFSSAGGSVTYSRPFLPYIGDVIISTAPLFLLPLALSFISWIFGTYLGCAFPAVSSPLEFPEVMAGLASSISGTIADNLLSRFNGWFLLYLYLTISLVLSIAPSPQDLKNAAAGLLLLILAGVLVLWSGIPWAVSAISRLAGLLGYGFMLGLVYGLVALIASLPLLLWYVYRHSF